MAKLAVARCCSAALFVGLALSISVAFVPGLPSEAIEASLPQQTVAKMGNVPPGEEGTPQSNGQASSPWAAAARVLAGVALGAVLFGASVGPARAEIEDVAIPVDGKGKTMNLTKEELIRGKRLFNAACSVCHVGGGTRTNQNVGLGMEELSGAFPPRNTINALVEYLNSPMTYDGIKDISELHPSIQAADLWPKMRSMKQQDLYDMSAYILYQNYVIPEKWGGGKQYY